MTTDCKENTDEQLNEVRRQCRIWIKNQQRDKNHEEIEIKATTNQMKNLTESIINRLYPIRERIFRLVGLLYYYIKITLKIKIKYHGKI